MSTQAQWHSASGISACHVNFNLAHMQVDLDPSAGGTGLPTPHDLLDAALAACTTLSLQLYVRRKGWALRELRVEVGHSTGEQGGHLMTRAIHLVGDLDVEQQATLLRIADACPVHKTLSGDISVVTLSHLQSPQRE
jgi:putative redox protein